MCLGQRGERGESEGGWVGVGHNMLRIDSPVYCFIMLGAKQLSFVNQRLCVNGVNGMMGEVGGVMVWVGTITSIITIFIIITVIAELIW